MLKNSHHKVHQLADEDISQAKLVTRTFHKQNC